MRWEDLIFQYHNYIYDLADSRTTDWLLVKSPWNPILVVICYLYFSVNARNITEKLPTYNLRAFIVLYNMMLVGLSAYMFIEFIASAFGAGYGIYCQPVDYTAVPSAIRMAKVCWLYYFSKYIELTETVVFALRKKYRQISVLHVYHHSTMICLWWLCVKYTPGGQVYLFGAFNSFVHTVMYTYYGLSSIGPFMQKYLWWKKYITILQLSQFVTLFFYSLHGIVIGCSFPSMMNIIMGGYAVTLFVLFSNFYIKSYINKKRKVYEIRDKQSKTK